MVLQGEVSEVLPGNELVHCFETLQHYCVFAIRVDHGVDLIVQLEFTVLELIFKHFGGLFRIKLTLVVNSDVVFFELVVKHLLNTDFSIDHFPIDIIIIVHDEIEETHWRSILVFKLDWHWHTDIYTALN